MQPNQNPVMNRKRSSAIILGGMLLVSTSCSTIYHGGSPELSSNFDNDITEINRITSNTSLNKILADSVITKEERDNFIIGRLVVMNINYLKFIKSLNADKLSFDSASDLLALSLNLAATAFKPADTKTVISATAAAVTGSKATIDKNYFFDKSVPALVTSMNAQRKLVLARILVSMQKPVEQYPIGAALVDLDEYYTAGSLIGAMSALQESAAKLNSEADEKLERAVRFERPATEQEKDRSKALKQFIDNDITTGNIDRIMTVLDRFEEIEVKKPYTRLNIQQALRKYRKDNLADFNKQNALFDELKKNGLIK